MLFLVNVVSQLFALNLFLGQDFHLFGVEVRKQLPVDIRNSSSAEPIEIPFVGV